MKKLWIASIRKYEIHDDKDHELIISKKWHYSKYHGYLKANLSTNLY